MRSTKLGKSIIYNFFKELYKNDVISENISSSGGKTLVIKKNDTSNLKSRKEV